LLSRRNKRKKNRKNSDVKQKSLKEKLEKRVMILSIKMATDGMLTLIILMAWEVNGSGRVEMIGKYMLIIMTIQWKQRMVHS
jgi:hypothetical protein